MRPGLERLGGDQGFNTPTNDRDVFIADFDLDGWDDFVTATTLSDGLSPSTSATRGSTATRASSGGNMERREVRGQSHPAALVSFSNNQPHNPRFCSVAAGDLTEQRCAGSVLRRLRLLGRGRRRIQPAGNDLNDRLLRERWQRFLHR